MTHDGAPSTYVYNDLEQLSKETDAKSSTDASPQVTSFTYTPPGQVYTETKPNGNVVTSTYYADNLPYTVTEKTSGGTLVSSHQYQYDPDGNTTQNTEQLMSADSSSSYLNHTLVYTYTPMDQVATVSTDGTQTESYTHDANNDVTAQTANGTTTTYGYSQGQMATATVGGTTADYNYDPFGRLDTITAAGQTIQSNTYDGFDHLTSTSQLTSTGSMATTSYTYDSLNRMATQTTGAGRTSFSYLGLSSKVASESDPGGTSKTYDYTPAGIRLSQTVADTSGTSTSYFSYNVHNDVEALTGTSGNTTATYGYSAYGNPVTSMFTGTDENDATPSATSTAQPGSAYRFNAMRWDGTSGQYDMGFRNYAPSLNQFVSRDMYDGATQNMALAADPFTGSTYAFGNGNPVSNIESDGHSSSPGSGDGLIAAIMAVADDVAQYKAGLAAEKRTSSGEGSGSSGSMQPQSAPSSSPSPSSPDCTPFTTGNNKCTREWALLEQLEQTPYGSYSAPQQQSYLSWLNEYMYGNVSACLIGCVSLQLQQEHVIASVSGWSGGQMATLLAGKDLSGLSAFFGGSIGMSSSSYSQSMNDTWQAQGTVADGLGLTGGVAGPVNDRGGFESLDSVNEGIAYGEGWDVNAGVNQSYDLNVEIPRFWDEISSGVSSAWNTLGGVFGGGYS